ncbi:hypothetical protein M422DRAFT_253393 [Sphaerobolus stellatus SS14]|uniref:Alpha-type protein kinase domain-containing protein n=1 Tax=Sphaerobolus stellatus (strain SS14) TaxID=990650 RepID=A0A0C9V861_SPHS4|nr:hypothetical protein M422DRAFT_253393 [Sphaerobolus stellatus SS14]
MNPKQSKISDGDSGIGDFGQEGIGAFIEKHTCTPMCIELGLAVEEGADEENETEDEDNVKELRQTHSQDSRGKGTQGTQRSTRFMGRNGYNNGQAPPPEELKKRLLEYAVEQLPLKQRLLRLAKDLSYHIKESTLKKLHREFDIPSARKFKLSIEETQQLVIDKVSHDVMGRSGPEKIRTKIAGILRCIVREIMHANWEDKFDKCFPRRRKKKLRGQLDALGPWYELNGDGHEKLDHKALQMGGVSIPAYGFQDKWSGAPLHLVVPNDHLAAAIGHVYLDLIEDYKLIPIQATFDKGSETAYTGGFQIALRKEFAPELTLEEFPAFVTLKSTDNIVIEGFWRWLREDSGINLYVVIKMGHTSGIFKAGNQLHAFSTLPLAMAADCAESNKLLPSGITPKEAYTNPESYGGTFMGIPLTNPCIIPALRDTLPITREEAFQWVSQSFKAVAEVAYIEIGSPKKSILTGWKIFSSMLPILEKYDPLVLDL